MFLAAEFWVNQNCVSLHFTIFDDVKIVAKGFLPRT